MRKLVAGALVLSGIGILVASAHAAPLSPDKLSAPKKPPAATCAWTTPLPALPAGCVAPTMANCTDPTYLAGTCGKGDAIQKGWCQKVLVEDYCKDKAEEELVYPAVDPKAPPVHIVTGDKAKPSPLYPPGAPINGRQVAPVALAKGGRPAIKLTPGSTTSQHGGATTIEAKNLGMGTFATSTLGSQVTRFNAQKAPASNLHLGLVRAQPAAQLEPFANQVFAQLGPQSWVGDGSDTKANRQVNSCAEYTYQRWYDFTRYRDAAKALGRDYRGIYNLALDPASPMNLEKAVLKQFAVGNLPTQWPKYGYVHDHGWEYPSDDPTIAIPRNVFYSPAVLTNSVPNTTKAQIQALLGKWVNAANYVPNGTTIMLPPPPGGADYSKYPKFELHRRLRNQIDARYHVSDDGFDERQIRQDAYAELLATHKDLYRDALCAQAPAICCNPPPQAVAGGGTKQQIINKIRGYSVINPDPTKIALPEADVGQIDRYNSFRAAEQLQITGAQMTQRPGALQGIAPPAAYGRKGKAPPLAQAQQPQLTYNLHTAAGLTCEQAWTAKKPAIMSALNAVSEKLSDMVVKEFGAGPNGCLGDPQGGDLGNSCDWSYEKFARMTMTYFDEEVEADFDKCNIDTKGKFENVKDPSKQAWIWPCEVKHDFSADQLDVAYYMDATDNTAQRASCDADRAAKALQAWLKDNAAIVKRIPITNEHLGESDGDTWNLGDHASFGADVSYNTSWYLKSDGRKSSDGAWCHPVGGTSMNASAGFWFFGSQVTIVDGGETEDTGGPSPLTPNSKNDVEYSAHAEYRDLTSSNTTPQPLFDPVKTRKPISGGKIDIPDSSAVIGDINYDFWISIGPIPVHIDFGATGSAGVSLKNLGHLSDADSCSHPGQPIEGQKIAFSAGTQFVPWAEGDAYAEAAVDLVIVSAGIRVDLVLLSLGVPTGVAVSVPTGASIKLDTGATLTVDALSGSVSAYVKIGIDPLSHSFESTIFSWDGLHSDTKLFGTTDSFPLKLASWAANPVVEPDTIKCVPTVNPMTPGRPYCLKQVMAATHEPDPKAQCVPYKSPNNTWCLPDYNLGGPAK